MIFENRIMKRGLHYADDIRTLGIDSNTFIKKGEFRYGTNKVFNNSVF